MHVARFFSIAAGRSPNQLSSSCMCLALLATVAASQLCCILEYALPKLCWYITRADASAIRADCVREPCQRNMPCLLSDQICLVRCLIVDESGHLNRDEIM